MTYYSVALKEHPVWILLLRANMFSGVPPNERIKTVYFESPVTVFPRNPAS